MALCGSHVSPTATQLVAVAHVIAFSAPFCGPCGLGDADTDHAGLALAGNAAPASTPAANPTAAAIAAYDDRRDVCRCTGPPPRDRPGFATEPYISNARRG